MKYVIDIDGTICKEVGEVIGREPYIDRIEKINKLYDEGHTIVYYTARGLKSGRGEKHYRPITEQQLKEWGVSITSCVFKGHNGDYFIDDRGINDFCKEDFFNDIDIFNYRGNNIGRKKELENKREIYFRYITKRL